MIALPLGKITTASAGTPQPITAAMVIAAASVAGVTLSPGGAAGLVLRVDVWADPVSTGNAYVVVAGTKLATLPPVPTSGLAGHWHSPTLEGNRTDPTQFAIDAANNGQGAYVTLWLE